MITKEIRRQCPDYLDANFERHLEAYVLAEDPVLRTQKDARLRTDLNHIRRRTPYHIFEAYYSVYQGIVLNERTQR